MTPTLTLNKKAVSLMVAYVILITIAVALSGIVYLWLKWYVTPPGEKVECGDGTAVVIQNYDCSENQLSMTISNKGLHSVKGFIVRVNDKDGATIGVYQWYEDYDEMQPGEKKDIRETILRDMNGVRISNPLTFVEVQPYIFSGDEKIFCENIATQTLNCQFV